MSNALTYLGGFVAAAASLVGVMVGVEQLTLRTSLRRTADLSTHLLASAHEPEQRSALTSIHDVASARLVALSAVPTWRFGEAALSLSLGPVVVGWLAARQGLSSLTVLLAVVGFFGSGPAARRSIRIYLERHRIAAEFLAGDPVRAPDLSVLHQNEGGTRIESVWGALLGLGTVAMGLGVGLLFHSPAQGFAVLPIVAGFMVCTWPIERLRRVVVRPLLPAASGSSPGVANPRSKPGEATDGSRTGGSAG